MSGKFGSLTNEELEARLSVYQPMMCDPDLSNRVGPAVAAIVMELRRRGARHKVYRRNLNTMAPATISMERY